MMRDQGRALVRIIIAGLVVACAPATVPAQQTGQPGGAPGGARPCDLAAYRQFDFWVGEWEVRAQGRTAGSNSVQRILDGCVIFENWTGAGGGTGKSFNFFNSATGKWQQTWVDSGGRVLELVGEAHAGGMRFAGESLTREGRRVMHRLIFTALAGDRVRQLWEQSRDGGQTWSVAFDGEYLRK